MRGRLHPLLVFAGALALFAAQTQRDGAVIVNSGSTNTAPYSITVWSDATAKTSVRGGMPATRTIPPALSNRFFGDLRAARANGSPPAHCMKSASFGTTTIVTWHGWHSPDLQCPPYSASVGALAADVRSIEAAAGIQAMTPHRIRLPIEPRKNPPTIPEVQPT